MSESSAKIIDYAITEQCSNPDVIHICHKCNRCGRFPGQPVNMDEMETECIMTPETCNLSDQVEDFGKVTHICHCTGGYCLQQKED